MSKREPKLKLFKTWTHKGVRFLAVHVDDTVRVIDEHGNNYGGWFDVESFRKRQHAEEMPVYETSVRLTIRSS